MILSHPLASHPITLLPDAAALIGPPENSALVIADLHLGKAATFRASGIPIPEGNDPADLARIAALIRAHRPAHVLIAGDLFHSRSGSQTPLIAALLAFIEEISLPFTLITGNHDRKLRALPPALNPCPHFDLGTIRIVHDPAESCPQHLNIAGHIHPVIRLREGPRTSFRLPCFHLSENCLTLPAFGSFTGGYPIQPQKTDRIFVTLRGAITELPPALLHPRSR